VIMTNQAGRDGTGAVPDVSLANNLNLTQGVLQIERCGLNCMIVEEALRQLLCQMGIRENLDILLGKLALTDFSSITHHIITRSEFFIRFYFCQEFEIKVSPCNGDASKCKWYNVADKA
jgi:hypothetical protein